MGFVVAVSVVDAVVRGVDAVPVEVVAISDSRVETMLFIALGPGSSRKATTGVLRRRQDRSIAECV